MSPSGSILAASFDAALGTGAFHAVQDPGRTISILDTDATYIYGRVNAFRYILVGRHSTGHKCGRTNVFLSHVHLVDDGNPPQE